MIRQMDEPGLWSMSVAGSNECDRRFGVRCDCQIGTAKL